MHKNKIDIKKLKLKKKKKKKEKMKGGVGREVFGMY